ncbi:MAG: hypothetical protein DCC55_00595 [Chloroflexi bacterium]|nr:MAG: hypothetical protein DCC55_00595 [Chloroflexota bacterium]
MATERKRSRARRSASAGQPRSYSELYKSSSAAPPATGQPASAVAPKTVQTVDWVGEYGYVITDLRRLLIVSAVLFGLIILAGFLF